MNNKSIILDSGPLGRIAHPRAKANREIKEWIDRQLESGADIFIPEIADYEVRRNFILVKLTESINRLKQLKDVFNYLPLNTETMLKAAEFWAQARRQGRPTADPRSLNSDVILAAQAHKAGAIIATENVGHLSLFVEAKKWKEIECSTANGL